MYNVLMYVLRACNGASVSEFHGVQFGVFLPSFMVVLFYDYTLLWLSLKRGRGPRGDQFPAWGQGRGQLWLRRF